MAGDDTEQTPDEQAELLRAQATEFLAGNGITPEWIRPDGTPPTNQELADSLTYVSEQARKLVDQFLELPPE